MLKEYLAVDACVTIQGACPAEYTICGKLIEFHFGGVRDGFHFAFDIAALRKLAALSAEAIAQWDAPSAENTAGGTSEPVGHRKGEPVA